MRIPASAPKRMRPPTLQKHGETRCLCLTDQLQPSVMMLQTPYFLGFGERAGADGADSGLPLSASAAAGFAAPDSVGAGAGTAAATAFI